MRPTRAVYAFVLLCSLVVAASRATCDEGVTFSSAGERVTLIELFTSQGCSSCPPAEGVLNALSRHPRLWSHYVPVALHVDYWDRLGWPDPYASRENTERQYRYRQAGALDSVYTPCFLVNGKEWRGWRFGEDPPLASGGRARLTAHLQDERLNVTYHGDEAPLTLDAAVLGFDLETEITRGENRGRTLEQHFVALRHQSADSNNGTWTLPIKWTDLPPAGRYALALWIHARGNLTPLQATGGWLPLPRPPKSAQALSSSDTH